MKQMMFARTFPAYHPKAGQPTHFIEKIWAALADMGKVETVIDAPAHEYFERFPADFQSDYVGKPKWHTIRAGERWKVGDMFSPRVWSGKPYRSKTITIAPPITVEKIWRVLMTKIGIIYIDGRIFEKVEILAANDGLTGDDFNDWFPANQHFEGQIICWNKNIEY